jgi:hypothetical protein
LDEEDRNICGELIQGLAVIVLSFGLDREIFFEHVKTLPVRIRLFQEPLNENLINFFQSDRIVFLFLVF